MQDAIDTIGDYVRWLESEVESKQAVIEAQEKVVEAARELNSVILAEINPLDKAPTKCPDYPDEVCMACIASSSDDLAAALEALNE